MRDLTTLYLTGANIRGSGLAHLSGLSQLQVLGLVRTKVGDEAIDHLVRFQELQTLILVYTEISLDGIRRIHRDLPRTEIRY